MRSATLGHAAETRAWRAAQGDEDETPTERKTRQAKPPAPPKARLGIRIDADLADRLKGVSNVSAFVSAAIRDALDRLGVEAQAGDGT